ncbi:MAG: hypothetical protein KIS65_00195 [Nitrosomonas sp.]|nr:hypothetical protein [Nitrosomonas sp.]MCW5617637.1 hypothetical protein [Nitrosomonas sp.]
MKIEFSFDEFDDDCVVEDLFEDSRVARIIDEMEFADDDNYFDDKDIQRQIIGRY